LSIFVGLKIKQNKKKYMAELKLNAESTAEQIKVLLDQNLVGVLQPHVNEIHEGLGKGIYFWLIKQNSLSVISRYVEIVPVAQSYYREIEGEKYVLVYLGTAGTGKSGGGDLTQRLNWHIHQGHTESNVCHGTLSTLRAGLGALASDDLIEVNTEAIVNAIMRENFLVYFIEYKDYSFIDNDELILIRKLMPALNLKNNPNALAGALDNSTKSYKGRRALVYHNTRVRIGCKQGEPDDTMRTAQPTNDTTTYGYQVIEDDGNCVSFFVLKGQRIDEVVRGVNGLPAGRCSYAIYNSASGEELRTGTSGNNVEANPNAQNIYTYFSNVDSNNAPRYKNIAEMMDEKGIEEIVVKVCRR